MITKYYVEGDIETLQLLESIIKRANEITKKERFNSGKIHESLAESYFSGVPFDWLKPSIEEINNVKVLSFCEYSNFDECTETMERLAEIERFEGKITGIYRYGFWFTKEDGWKILLKDFMNNGSHAAGVETTDIEGKYFPKGDYWIVNEDETVNKAIPAAELQGVEVAGYKSVMKIEKKIYKPTYSFQKQLDSIDEKIVEAIKGELSSLRNGDCIYPMEAGLATCECPYVINDDGNVCPIEAVRLNNDSIQVGVEGWDDTVWIDLSECDYRNYNGIYEFVRKYHSCSVSSDAVSDKNDEDED